MLIWGWVGWVCLTTWCYVGYIDRRSLQPTKIHTLDKYRNGMLPRISDKSLNLDNEAPRSLTMLFTKSSLVLSSRSLLARTTTSRMMLYSTTTTTTTTTTSLGSATSNTSATQDEQLSPVDLHAHFHALYNNENQSVLADLDHPHNEVSTSTFAPTFNSVFDE
ncbi:hypothetical protein BC941DRAFT_414332 [Chlamydoabsidia padenii]|nr:hypothetical protein BC941DRAFT_414332 [Chlamydoabsidia padenii]